MKKLVIAGSASLQKEIKYWKNFWERKNYQVIDTPKPIAKETFLKEYPKIHENFFKNLTTTDTLFVMNEDKNNIKGYLGAESFAEMCFTVAQNLLYKKNIKIILLQMPTPQVQSYEEIMLWLKLDWVKLFQNS